MSKHTPGPWTSDMQFIVGQHRGKEVYLAEIVQEDDEGRVAPSSQQDANGELMAKAPELEKLRRDLVREFGRLDRAVLRLRFRRLHTLLQKAEEMGQASEESDT